MKKITSDSGGAGDWPVNDANLTRSRKITNIINLIEDLRPDCELAWQKRLLQQAQNALGFVDGSP
jgi:hypothetical protein